MLKKYRIVRLATVDSTCGSIHDDVRIFIDGKYNDFDTLEEAESFLFKHMELWEEWTILTIYSYVK